MPIPIQDRANGARSDPSYPYVKARNLQVEIPEGVNRISLIAKNPQWYSYLPNPDGPGQPWRADESTDKTVDVFKHTEPYMILCVACKSRSSGYGGVILTQFIRLLPGHELAARKTAPEVPRQGRPKTRDDHRCHGPKQC